MQAIFVGGTGRSGTTVMGQLLGRHPAIVATLPKEVRFITDPGGLIELVRPPTDESGVADLERLMGVDPGAVDRFVELLSGKWWRREGPDGGPRGLHRGIDRVTLEAAIDNFIADVTKSPLAAGQDLIRALIDPMAARSGARAWVETTPANAASAAGLHQLVPDLKLIHMQRDPRDTIASLVGQAWGPDSVADAIVWWRRRAALADRECRLIPQQQLLTLRLEDLVAADRTTSYTNVLSFVGVDDHPLVRAFFEEAITPEAAGLGRWHHLDSADRRLLVDAFGD